MTSHLSELHLLNRYATNRDDLLGDFYEPCLDRSLSYDRAVGYFHSSFFLLAVRPVARFASRGGKIRLICSPELSQQDISALDRGYELRLAIGDALCRAIDKTFEDPGGRPVIEFLATLVASYCMDLRIAFRPGAFGIFHDKIGLFRDADDNRVS